MTTKVFEREENKVVNGITSSLVESGTWTNGTDVDATTVKHSSTQAKRSGTQHSWDEHTHSYSFTSNGSTDSWTDTDDKSNNPVDIINDPPFEVVLYPTLGAVDVAWSSQLLLFGAYDFGAHIQDVIADAYEGFTYVADAFFGIVDGFLDTINPLDYWFSIPDIGPIFGHQDVYNVGYWGGVGIGFVAGFAVGNFAAGAGALAGNSLRTAAQVYTAVDTAAGGAAAIQAGINLAQGNGGAGDLLQVGLGLAPLGGSIVRKLDCFVAGTGVWMAVPVPAMSHSFADRDESANGRNVLGDWDDAVLFAGMFVPAAVLTAKRRRRRAASHRNPADDSTAQCELYELTEETMRKQSRDLAIDQLFDSGEPIGFRGIPEDSPEDGSDPTQSADLALIDWDSPDCKPSAHRVERQPERAEVLLSTSPALPRKTRATSAAAPPRTRWATAIALLIGLSSFAGWLWGLGGSSPPTFPAITPVTAQTLSPDSSAAVPYRKPIEEVQLGERVLADNPDPDRAPNFLDEPDQSTWRRVHLVLLNSENDEVWIELLRPVNWIEERRIEAGSFSWMELPELGASGPTLVVSVAACPQISDGAGHIVTGWFCHQGDDLVDVVADDASVTCTASHPFWSEDRKAFVPAGQLLPAERLRTHEAKIIRLTNVVPRAGPATVFNIEVNLEHTYYVGDNGLLAHNNCLKTGKGRDYITYNGVRNGRAYSGIASAPSKDGLSPEQILSRRYSGNFNSFGGKPPEIIFHGSGAKGKQIARGLEQHFFNRNATRYGRGGVDNFFRPVSRFNPERRAYLLAAREHLQTLREP